MWDLSSAHPQEGAKVLTGHEGSVSSLRFGRDPFTLYSGGGDHSARIWFLNEGGDVAERVALSGHDGVVAQLQVAADGAYLVSGSFDGSARVWPLGTKALLRQACGALGRGANEAEWKALAPSIGFVRGCD